ncbi:MAG: 2-dehydropantoate 2-reductase [Rhodocyclaceae bacterium]|nr:2-dehydropantoate 2-reductase [Rhodocyclaceae bacterium]
MKICVFGAGAVGGVIAARLALAGNAISVIARGPVLEALRRHGLRLQQDGRSRAVRVDATDRAADLGPQDLLVIAVKQPSLAALAVAAAPLVADHTRILLAMNGVPWWFFDGAEGPLAGTTLRSVDPDGDLRRRLPTGQVLGCVVHCACDTPEPGTSRLTMGNRLIIGEALGASSSVTAAIADLLRGAGFQVAVSDQVRRDIWYKLWGNMTMNPVSALTGATTDRILDDPLVNAFCCDIMAEAARIGERIGCRVGQIPQARIAVTRELGAMKTSMLQDVEAGRPLELAAMLGAVLEIADRVGVAAPNMAALHGLTRLFAQVRGLV